MFVSALNPIPLHAFRGQQERSRPLSNNTRSNRTENVTFNSVSLEPHVVTHRKIERAFT